jgi:hypothetical protein
MKVGSLNYATHSGLGILAKEFYDNRVITDVLIKYHPNFTTHREWYLDSEMIGDSEQTNVAEDMAILERFIRGLDILFVFESPWHLETIHFAQKYNIPVACMPSYEWSPFPLHADIFFVTSLLDLHYYKVMYPNHRVEMVLIPVNSNVRWKLREQCQTFLHNAGNGSSHDRNGTQVLIEALPYIDSPITLKIKAQSLPLPFVKDPRVELINRDLPFSELWDGADTFVFVERFAGLSLPLQEAYSSGMLVIAGNRFPINTWLPINPLVNPVSYEELSFVNIPFQSAIYDHKDIARKIDEFYGMDISFYSLLGKKWAEENSWERIRPQYIDRLESLLR